MPNRVMENGADEYIMEFFSPYFDRIAFYSRVREPDCCDDYRDRWYRDVRISQNAVPFRFELASFYRIVRDADSDKVFALDDYKTYLFNNHLGV